MLSCGHRAVVAKQEQTALAGERADLLHRALAATDEISQSPVIRIGHPRALRPSDVEQ
jgi:hypothetical protein